MGAVIAHQELDIEMANHLDASFVQLAVQFSEPLGTLVEAGHGKMRGVTTKLRRVNEAVEEATV